MTPVDYLEKAQEAENAGEWGRAAKLYEEALKTCPEDRKVLEKLAWCLSRDRQHEKAIERSLELHKRFPSEAKWPYMIGYQYYDQKEWESSIGWFDKALALKPDYVVVLYRKGYAHHQIGQVGAALRAYALCRKIWHDLPDGPAKERDRKNCAKAAYHQASLMLDNPRLLVPGSESEIVPILEEAVALDPEDHNKHYRLGATLLMSDRPEAALEALQEADRLSRGKDYVLDKLAQAYAATGRSNDAVKCYERIPQQRRRPYIKRNFGKLLLDLDQPKEAEQMLREVVRQEPKNHNGHFYLAKALMALQRVSEAASELKTAIETKRERYKSRFAEAEELLSRIETEHPDALESSGDPNRGVVEEYHAERGFGFIRADDGKRRFFHITECRCKEEIKPGLRVSFQPQQTDKGLRAINVDSE